MEKTNRLGKGAELTNISDLPLFDNLNEWLTTSEAAGYLKISKGSLLNMVWRKQVRPHKLGRRNRYLKSDLSELIFERYPNPPKKEV